MRNWIRFITSGLAVLASFAVLVTAQIAVPFPTFTAGTTIQPDEINQNFAKFGDALNRTGGTMTGTLTTRDLLPDGHNTRDLGVTGTRYRDGWFGRNVAIGGTLGATGAATFGSTLAASGTATLRDILPESTAAYDVGLAGTRFRDGWFSRNLDIGGTFALTGTAAFNNAGAAAIDVAGGITAGSGNVSIIGTDGRIPALTSTYLANVSGAALTGVLEANITDGTVYPRLAAAENISGAWRFGQGVIVGSVATAPAATLEVLSAGDGAAGVQGIRVSRADGTYMITNVDDGGATAWGSIQVGDGGTFRPLKVNPLGGGLSVGDGTAIASIITNTMTLDLPALGPGDSWPTFMTMTGVQQTSPCFVGMWVNVAGVSKAFQLTAAYSATNQIIVTATNSDPLSVDPASATLRVTCFTY